MKTETKTFYPGDPKDSNVASANNAIGKSSTNNSYASFSASKNSSKSVSWPFSVTGIPDGATIDKVECKAKYCASSFGGTCTVQLRANTTNKGASAQNSSTSATVSTLTGASWTVSDLAGANLYTTIKSGSSGICAFRFYGADFSVTYTYKNEQFMLKVNGVYTGVPKVYKKVNGSWVLQEELSGVVDQTRRLVRGD